MPGRERLIRKLTLDFAGSFGFTSGLAFGYDVVANGASISMPAFLLYFGDMGATEPYLPSLWTSLWTGMSALFQAAGAIIIGWLADRFGRKWPSCSAAVVTMIGTVLQYVAVSRVVLLWGKMITGLGVGALMATGATYISEVSDFLMLSNSITMIVMLATNSVVQIGYRSRPHRFELHYRQAWSFLSYSHKVQRLALFDPLSLILLILLSGWSLPFSG
jgi:MFS family permease